MAEAAIATLYTPKLRGFLAFVLAHYVSEGVRELDQEKLKPLLRLKYGAITDAVDDLGDPAAIGEVFADLQRYLY